MTSEFAAAVVALAVLILVIGLLVAFASLTKTLRVLRTTVEEFRTEALPVVASMRTAVTQANAELERVDTLLDSAESISTTVDSFSRLAYLAFSNPVVKVMAIGAGLGRGARRFRKAE